MIELKHQLIKTKIIQDQRDQVNQVILNGLNDIPLDQIYNVYTGKGKLHGLDFSEFDNRYLYTEAKKAHELGQFFTPHETAEQIVKAVQPFGEVLDPCCGSGRFCNFVDEKRFTGVDSDKDAVRVGKALFPRADFRENDIQYWYPSINYDFIITNPPYNLRWKDGWQELSSQSYILRKSHDWLNPYGVFVAIVPSKYLEDEMFFKQDIEFIKEHYNWLGSVELPVDTFYGEYDIKFPTKVIAFQNIKGKEYNNNRITFEQLSKNVEHAKGERKRNVHKSLKGENDFSIKNPHNNKGDGFKFKVKKCLYEIKQQQPKKLDNAIALLHKLESQTKPDDMEWEEWSKKRMTRPRVLSLLKRMSSTDKKHRRKKKDRNGADPKQLIPFSEVVPNESDVKFLKEFQFKNGIGQFYLNDMQQGDCAKMLSKNYGILNWEQGVGKSPAGYAIAKRRNVLTIILSKPLAINNTWIKFMEQNGEEYSYIKTEKDLDFSKKFWLLKSSTLSSSKRLQQQLKRQLRRVSNNVQLIIDESDNLCNRSSKFYKATRSALIKCKYKLLTTGTTTRNNAKELYPQLEFLYNNSNNFTDNCSYKYVKDKKNNIVRKINDNQGQPFSAYRGLTQFEACFSPAKSSVFGVDKHDQNVYNYDQMIEVLNYTSIVRTFKEVVGKKHDIEQILVNFSEAEKAIQVELLKEFYKICYLYFNSTGNARKEAGLRRMRQLKLLIKSTSLPESFVGHGVEMSNKRKRIIAEVNKIDDKVCIGCTLKDVAKLYYSSFADQLERPLFYIDGGVSFKNREKIIRQFEASRNGILICTQQSLESSVNIPTVNHCFIESLQWNIPRMSQFYFRFIRFNSKENTTIYFVNYAQSIENNLLSLLMAKEKINKALKLEEDNNRTELFEMFGLEWIEEFLRVEYNEQTETYEVGWGAQSFV